MGQHVTLTASDNFKLGAYRADPAGPPKAAVVVIQEIFGVNHHIRAVTDRFAQQGYVAVAPAIFDRVRPGFESGYSQEEIAEARKFLNPPDIDAALRDIQAAIDSVTSVGPVATVGFCYGGTLAFLAATRLRGLAASVGYYGGMIAKSADEKPKVPTMLHFGEKDAGIPLSDVDIVKAKRSDCTIHVYPNAQHGFSCDERASYDKPSADLAGTRTRDFLAQHLTA